LKVSKFPTSLFRVVKTHGLQLGEDCADENLRLNANYEAVGIVRYPYCAATKFPVRLQFEILADAFQLQIQPDCVVRAGADRNLFAAGYSNGGKIGICRRVNGKPINAILSQRLSSQVKRRGVQIKQVGQSKLPGLCLDGGALTFCS